MRTFWANSFQCIVAWDKVVLSGAGDVVFSATLDNVADKLSGAATVDATNLSGALKVTLADAGSSVVKGGSAADTITTGSGGLDILTGNGGADTFNLSATKVAGGGTISDSDIFNKLVSITDFKVSEKDSLSLAASTLTSLTKVELTSGQTAAAKAAELCNTAAGGGSNVNLEVSWFQDGTDTYVILNTGAANANTNDVVVKLQGLVDLSEGVISSGSITFN